MTIIYYDGDADPTVLDGRKIGVVGFSELGRAIALNMRDRSLDILCAGVDQDEQNNIVLEDLPHVATIGELVQQANTLVIAISDERLVEVYMQEVSPHLRKGHMLVFLSSYNLTFGFVEPPPFVDVGLMSPRASGKRVRTAFENDDGVISFLAVAQDASRRALQILIAIAEYAGLLDTGAIEIPFEQEVQLSLFVQQAIIPAFHKLMVTAMNVLLATGYVPEAVLTDLYLSGKFNDYVRTASKSGLMAALKQGSMIEQFASLTHLESYNELRFERLMENMLEEIRSGQYSRDWSREYTDGHPRLDKLLKLHERQDIWDWEQQTLDILGDEEDY